MIVTMCLLQSDDDETVIKNIPSYYSNVQDPELDGCCLC